MSSNQPHIHEVGAFNPVEAFTETFANMAKMLAGLQEDNEAVPPLEVMRAATTTIDLLEAITTVTVASLMASAGQVVGPEVYSDARAEYFAAKMARSPEEEALYRQNLMRKVSHSIPHEMPFDPDDGEN